MYAELMALLMVLAGPVASEESAVPTPLQPLPTLISWQDYPDEALKNRQQGSVRFRLDITPEGRVAGCTVLKSSRSRSLDATTCRIMTSRARFAAAAHPSSNLRSLESTITWRLGKKIDASPQLDVAIRGWSDCVLGAAVKRSRTSLTVEEISTLAFSSCAANEPLVTAAMQGSGIDGDDTAEALRQVRDQIRDFLVTDVNAVRRGRKR